MFRKSMIYRRWWYIKKRNIRKIRLLLRFTIVAVIMCLVAIFVQCNILQLMGF